MIEMVVKRTIRKLGIICLCLSSVFCFSGCWDYQELNERVLVIATGFDVGRQPDEMKATQQYLIPEKVSTAVKGSQSAENAVHTVSIYVRSMGQLIDEFDKMTPADPYYQVKRFVLVSDEMAKKGIEGIVDYYYRYLENRYNTSILLVHGKAEDYLNWKTPVSNVPGQYFEALIKLRSATHIKKNVDILRILKVFSTETKSLYLQSLKMEKVPSGSVEIKNDNLGVFKGSKLLAFLSEKESRGLLLLDNNLSTINLEVQLPQNEGKVNLSVLRTRTQINPELTGEKINMRVEVFQEGNISFQTDGTKLSSQKNLKMLETLFANEVEKDMRAALKRVQEELRTDVLGFGEKIYRKYPNEWGKIKNRWESLYPEVEVSYQVNTRVRGVNLTFDPIEKGKEGY